MEATLDAIPVPKRSVACQICTAHSAKYTCPRCGFKTCSLDCSKVHKSGTTTTGTDGCSGIKDNNAGGFVAMNTYGYSAFVDDYVFLEEVGRHVGEWGRDIREKKLLGNAGSSSVASNRRGRGARMMGGGHRGEGRGGKGRSKREVLRDMLLERADVDMQLCPQGMERRKMNQSSWDAKANTGYLTIQYRVHKSENLTTSNHDRQARPSTKRKNMSDPQTGEVTHLLTHRNNIEMSIKDSLRRAVEEWSKKDGAQPTWIREMITGDETRAVLSIEEKDDSAGTGGGYVVLIRGPAVPLEKGFRVAYERLDTSVALVEALRGHSFVEFPTLEVVHEREWSEVGREWERNAEGKEGESDESDKEEDRETQERKFKRRKIDKDAGKRLLGGLKAYGEEDDDGEGDSDPRDDPEKKPAGLLEMLEYSSDSSEASELEDIEVAPVHAGRTTLDRGDEEEVDWDDE